VLIPLIIHFGVKTENERGLLVAKRSAHVALLLVDTNSGDLIWSGGREAEVVAKAFAADPQAKDLQAPSQEELQQRLLTNALWLMFPGRQVYK